MWFAGALPSWLLASLDLLDLASLLVCFGAFAPPTLSYWYSKYLMVSIYVSTVHMLCQCDGCQWWSVAGLPWLPPVLGLGCCISGLATLKNVSLKRLSFVECS